MGTAAPRVAESPTTRLEIRHAPPCSKTQVTHNGPLTKWTPDCTCHRGEKHMFNWSDPNTFWLNITDIALGIVTLASLAFVAQAAFREVYARLANRVSVRLHEDAHAFRLPRSE